MPKSVTFWFILLFFREHVNQFGLDDFGPEWLWKVPTNEGTHCYPE
jgi:hypothetical protein